MMNCHPFPAAGSPQVWEAEAEENYRSVDTPLELELSEGTGYKMVSFNLLSLPYSLNKGLLLALQFRRCVTRVTT